MNRGFGLAYASKLTNQTRTPSANNNTFNYHVMAQIGHKSNGILHGYRDANIAAILGRNIAGRGGRRGGKRLAR